MIKTKFIPAILAIAASLAACSDDTFERGNGEGKIAASFTADYSVRDARATTKAGVPEVARPDVASFYVHLSNSDGTIDRTWSEVAQVPTDEKFPIGNYTLEAYYGDIDTEGFDSPYYHGSTNFTIRDGETTNVDVTASLANTMVSLEYTDNFKQFFSQYSVTLHSAGGAYINFPANEERAAYVKPGDVNIAMDVTTQDGRQLQFEPAKIAGAMPKTHYRITFDVNGGEVGAATLIIIFDATTQDVAPITIDLSDDLFNAEPPTITPMGFTAFDETAANVISLVEGDSPANDIKAAIFAMGGIKEINLTTQSAYLIAKGWPQEVNLLEATTDNLAKFNQYGLKTAGVWGNTDGKSALVDFTAVIENLHPYEGNSDHIFSLQVKDLIGRVSEPVAVKFAIPAVVLQLPATATMVSGTGVLSFTVTYNGSKFGENVSFQMLRDSGAWSNIEITSFTDQGDGTYTVVLNAPASAHDFSIRAVYKNGIKTTDPMTIEVSSPTLTLSYNETDVWATKATMSIATDEGDVNAITTISSIFLSTDQGATYTKAKTTAHANTLTVTGLTPDTEYTAVVSALGTTDNASEPITFTTEETLQVPNGDFEQLSQTINISQINQGGPWSDLGHWAQQQTRTSITVNEPQGWASVNAKTCSVDLASTDNTWFVIPSTFSTGTAQHGSNAMVVRNVSFDYSGSAPGRHTNTNTHPYNGNAPGTIAHNAAGKLFLGTYAINATTGNNNSITETYNEGVEFTSRPTALHGFYTYSRDSQDASEQGVVTVELLSGDQVIAKGNALLNPAGSFTEFVATLTYSVTNKKATALKIMITSSNHASYTQTEETVSIVTTKRATETEQCAYGAILTIDNLSFTY